MNYIITATLCLSFFFNTSTSIAQSVPEPCPEGEMISLDWPEKEHIVAPGCYTQEAADSWCQQNFKTNTTASPDGEHLFCSCTEGYTMNLDTNECEAEGLAEDDNNITDIEDTCQCPNAASDQ